MLSFSPAFSIYCPGKPTNTELIIARLTYKPAGGEVIARGSPNIASRAGVLPDITKACGAVFSVR